MKIIIAGRGMPHGPFTVENTGLGGSETAQVCMARELARLGAEVHNYVDLSGAPPGYHDGVNWHHVDDLQIRPQSCDVLIVCRNPAIIHTDSVKTEARVLWVQDFACGYYPPWKLLPQFKRIFYVSKWQRDQWEAWAPDIGYKLPAARITRNGIMRHDMRQSDRDMEPLIDSRLLTFASRPERGLECLVRPGGVMDCLPDNYKLQVCGYDDYPKQYAPFYEKVFGWAKAHPKVILFGSQRNKNVRLMLSKSAGLVLPTDYPETSCMLAREAIEVQCPVFTTPVDPQMLGNRGSGALEETLRGCGWISAPVPYGTDEFCQEFANLIQHGLERHEDKIDKRVRMLTRKDLYWDEVARDWLSQFYQMLEHEV